MLNVRSRASVVAITGSVAVFVGLPVVAFAQVPSVDQVVGGATDTVNGVVQQAPVPAPSLPAPSVPSVPSVPSLPNVQVPSVPSAPAPTPAPAPVPIPKAPSLGGSPGPPTGGSAPAAQAPGGSGSGSAPASTQARSAAGGSQVAGGGGGKSSARRGTNANRSGKGGDATRGERSSSGWAGDIAAAASQSGVTDGAELALASQRADDLPDDASPAKLPFSGLQLALMAITGLAALATGMALRRGTHLHFRRAAS